MSDILILDEENQKSKKVVWDDQVIWDEQKWKNKTLIDTLNDYFISLQRVKIKDKVIFYRLLATMINAGISLVKAITILEKQEKNAVLKKIFTKFKEELKEWKNFSECLELYPASFDEAEVGMIKAGEKTWKLNDTLLEIADQVEKIASISGKIKGAMIYPAMILLVVFGVVFVMMTMVVPKLLDIFTDKSTLPPATQILIGISDVFTNYWFFMILGGVAIVAGINFWRKIPSWKYSYDKFVLAIPVFWWLSRKLILSKFCRVFSGLLWSGVSIVEALKIVSEAAGNEVYRQRILLLMEDVRQGMKIWESLDSDSLFPDMMVQMIQVGEQTAKLDQTISKVADFYDEQVDNTVAVLNKLLEPFIIVFLAVVVWFIAIAIMQPIMWLADQVAAS
jgi:type IV pilus assembly protein PilC